MAQKPPSEQCIKHICKVIEDYCKSQNCPSQNPLDNVEAIYIVFFRNNGKVRLHLLGEVSAPDMIEAFQATIAKMMHEDQKEGNPLAA